MNNLFELSKEICDNLSISKEDFDVLIDESINDEALTRQVISKQTKSINELDLDPLISFGITYFTTVGNLSQSEILPIISKKDSYYNLKKFMQDSGSIEKEIVRILINKLKCKEKNIPYKINDIKETDYSKYFNIIETNNIPCVFCKSLETQPISTQVRAADEEATVKYFCKSCGKSFNPPRFKRR